MLLRLLIVVASSLIGTFPRVFNFWSKTCAPLVPTRFSSISLNFCLSSGLKNTFLVKGAGLKGGLVVGLETGLEK